MNSSTTEQRLVYLEEVAHAATDEGYDRPELAEAAQRALDGKEPFPSTGKVSDLDPARQELIGRLSNMTLTDLQQKGRDLLDTAIAVEEYNNAEIVPVTFRIKPGSGNWFREHGVGRFQESYRAQILSFTINDQVSA